MLLLVYCAKFAQQLFEPQLVWVDANFGAVFPGESVEKDVARVS